MIKKNIFIFILLSLFFTQNALASDAAEAPRQSSVCERIQQYFHENAAQLFGLICGSSWVCQEKLLQERDDLSVAIGFGLVSAACSIGFEAGADCWANIKSCLQKNADGTMHAREIPTWSLNALHKNPEVALAVFVTLMRVEDQLALKDSTFVVEQCKKSLLFGATDSFLQQVITKQKVSSRAVWNADCVMSEIKWVACLFGLAAGCSVAFDKFVRESQDPAMLGKVLVLGGGFFNLGCEAGIFGTRNVSRKIVKSISEVYGNGGVFCLDGDRPGCLQGVSQAQIDALNPQFPAEFALLALLTYATIEVRVGEPTGLPFGILFNAGCATGALYQFVVDGPNWLAIAPEIEEAIKHAQDQDRALAAKKKRRAEQRKSAKGRGYWQARVEAKTNFKHPPKQQPCAHEIRSSQDVNAKVAPKKGDCAGGQTQDSKSRKSKHHRKNGTKGYKALEEQVARLFAQRQERKRQEAESSRKAFEQAYQEWQNRREEREQRAAARQAKPQDERKEGARPEPPVGFSKTGLKSLWEIVRILGVEWLRQVYWEPRQGSEEALSPLQEALLEIFHSNQITTITMDAGSYDQEKMTAALKAALPLEFAWAEDLVEAALSTMPDKVFISEGAPAEIEDILQELFFGK